MNISILISSLGCGGAERVVAILANAWAEAGIGVNVLTFNDTCELPFYKLDSRVKHIPLNLKRQASNVVEGASNNLWRIIKIRQAVKASACDVLIALMEGTTCLAILSTRGLGIPVIVSEVATPELQAYSMPWTNLRKVLYPRANALVVPSNGMCKFFVEKLNLQPVVIANPILEPDSSFKLYQKSTATVLAVGRLSPEKGFDDLIRSWAKVHAINPDAKLRIVGEGRERKRLELLIVELGLSTCIALPGLSDNLEREYAQAEFLVVSSHYEGFGNVIAEALARQLPVVSFNCPSGPAELIIHQQNGLLVENRNIQALADSICLMLKDQNLRARLSLAGPQILQKCGLSAVMKQWDAVIKKVLA